MDLSRKLIRTALLGAVLTALWVVGASAADLGVGTVNAEALRLRAEADPNGSILATATKGDIAVVLSDTEEGWYEVDYKSIRGYMSAQFLDVETSVEIELGFGRVQTDGTTLNVRSGPGTDYDQVATLCSGTVVTLNGMEDGWYKIAYGEDSEGYVSSDYIVACKDATGARGDSDTAGSPGQQVVDYAMQFLGTPYVWGGNGPNCFDCSGFTKFVYSHFGYTLNRTASAQLYNGTKVARGEWQPGDLIFFNNGKVSTPVSHVGIYIGNGLFVHASTNSYIVEVSNLFSTHYSTTYAYARRVFN